MPDSRMRFDIWSIMRSVSGLDIIWRKRSERKTSRTCGPIACSCGLEAMIWSRTAGLDMTLDICWRNWGELSMFCICEDALSARLVPTA